MTDFLKIVDIKYVLFLRYGEVNGENFVTNCYYANASRITYINLAHIIQLQLWFI